MVLHNNPLLNVQNMTLPLQQMVANGLHEKKNKKADRYLDSLAINRPTALPCNKQTVTEVIVS